MQPDHPKPQIVRGDLSHVQRIATLRHALWPEDPVESHAAELRAQLGDPDSDIALFLALDADGAPLAFADVALRMDYVNGCESSPVAFLEGIYVDAVHRRQGIARALVEAAQAWGREEGCAEFASDALLDNEESHRFHRAMGFEETERVVYYRKLLSDPSA
jgi:aminoglycoside 6'-N-acetyltransferase I